MLSTPVALIVFRRPDLTARVLERIAQAKPRKLLVIADGPRPDRPDEVRACAETRAVIDRVNWDCEVIQNYADANLGCGHRVATGLDWVFDQVEEAIILEDDCNPHPTFFRYCEEMLDRYRHDGRIMHVAGSTYRAHAIRTTCRYFFLHFNGDWGWETWRRAWRRLCRSVECWLGLVLH